MELQTRKLFSRDERDQAGERLERVLHDRKMRMCDLVEVDPELNLLPN